MRLKGKGAAVAQQSAVVGQYVNAVGLIDIDAVANATITSQAVVNAINAACGAEAAPAVDAVTDATSAATGAVTTTYCEGAF